MQKIKRVLAMAGVILIIVLYVITIILGIFGNEQTIPLLKASLAATVIVPVMLWAYTFIYKLLDKNYRPKE